MDKTGKSSFRLFVISTYLLFWALFLLTGLTAYLKAPDIVQKIMQHICGWASTFVLVFLFRRIRPGESFRGFLKKQFGRVGLSDFLVPAAIQVTIAMCAIVITTLLGGGSLMNLRMIQFPQFSGALLFLIDNLTFGPMGEELGWRGYALNELRKRHSLLTSSVVIGLLWGFWHFPLWLISGYAGWNLLFYSVSFLLGITGCSVFIGFFYSRSKNVLTAVWMHLLFNILMQVVIFEGVTFLLVVSLLYVFASTILVLANKEEMLQLQPAGIEYRMAEGENPGQ